MSDPAEESIRLVTVTLELPEGLLEAYDALVGKRISIRTARARCCTGLLRAGGMASVHSIASGSTSGTSGKQRAGLRRLLPDAKTPEVLADDALVATGGRSTP